MLLSSHAFAVINYAIGKRNLGQWSGDRKLKHIFETTVAYLFEQSSKGYSLLAKYYLQQENQKCFIYILDRANILN
jgi:hypothetical protein